jgi:WD40 repeat protein
VSADGRIVVTGSNDGTARLWEAATGREIRRLEGSLPNFVSSVAISPDGRTILTGSNDGMASLWEAATGREIRRLKGHTKPISSAVFSPDGRSILTGSEDKTARIWEEATSREIRRLEGHSGGVLSVAFAPGGHAILTGSEDETVRLWDAATGREIRRLEGHGKAGASVAFSHDGTTILTGSVGGSVRLWDAATGHELRNFRGHVSTVSSVAFAPDGSTILTGSYDKSARLWDTNSGREIRRLEGHEHEITSVAFASDGLTLLTGSLDTTARLWEGSTGREIRRLEGHNEGVSSVAFSPDGRALLTGSQDKTVRFWDLATGRETRRLLGHSDQVTSVAFALDGRTILTGSKDKTARLWDAARGREIRRFEGHRDQISCVAFAPDGRTILTGSWDGSARLWDAASGREIRRLEVDTLGGYTNGVSSVAFAPDGRTILTAHIGWVRQWDVTSGQEIRRYEGHKDLLRPSKGDMVPSKRIIPHETAGNNNVEGELPDVPPATKLESFMSVAFGPDGRTILTGSDGGTTETARLWDTVTGREIRRFEGRGRIFNSVAYSPDGRRILAGSQDGTASLWELHGGDEIQLFEGHGASIDSVAFGPDGHTILTGSKDKSARLWDAATGREFCRFVSFHERIWAVADPDSRFDTNNLEEIKGLHWVFPDDPFKPLSLETFMRDYFEPRLLPRDLAREGFRPVRPLSELNRVQPRVGVANVALGAEPGFAQVSVEVASAEGQFGREGRLRQRSTNVYDVRLFRDGQLVGRWPEPPSGDDAKPEPDPTNPKDMAEWRDANLVPLVDGKATKTFTVRLPHEPGRTVQFTAYAFNEDRVKSATATAEYTVPAGVPKAEPRAYVVGFGAAGFSDPAWDLNFSAGDARLATQELGKALKQAGRYEVVPVVLATDRGTAGRPARPGESSATAANLKAVLERLAGRPVDPAALAAIPGADKVTTATPDDLVIIFASSHGYTDREGAYYLFPSDIGPVRSAGRSIDEERDKALLDACISSGELSAWLRGVDAGQLALVVDCCHAAATVEQPGFKAGPMGSRGLGQLAYDKAMRVLAASAADDVALEALVKGEGNGLLTYALIREGLMNSKAAEPERGLTLGGLMKYAEGQVPTLYAEVVKAAEASKGEAGGARVLVSRGAELEPVVGGGLPEGSSLLKRNAFQTPALFDYARGRDARLGAK